MIKKTTFLLALIITPALFGMNVMVTRARLVNHYVKVYPNASKEEKIGKLYSRISELDAKIAKMEEEAPRALDKLTEMESYEDEIQAVWEAIDILNGQQPSDLDKAVEHLSATQSRFERVIKDRYETQKDIEYYNTHNKSATQPKLKPPFNESDWKLSVAILGDDPEAATKIAAQRQATQIKLDKAADPKEKAKLTDDSKWLSWLEKVAKK